MPNGVLELTLEVARTPDFVDWIGGYYNDCRVVSPPEVRELVIRMRKEAEEEAGWEELSAADATGSAGKKTCTASAKADRCKVAKTAV